MGVAHGEEANVVVVKQADGGLAVVPGPLPVLHRGQPLGFRATDPVSLSMDGVALDPLEGDGTTVGDRARIGLAAVAVGLASGALREGTRYAGERQLRRHARTECREGFSADYHRSSAGSGEKLKS